MSEITVLGQPWLDLVLEVQQHLDRVGIDLHHMRVDPRPQRVDER
jgi:hypothetical protein